MKWPWSETPLSVEPPPTRPTSVVLDELLEAKLKTKEGTSKVASYAASYVSDRVKYNGAFLDPVMGKNIVKILRACSKHLEQT